VNCPFYFKIGACRHGERCTRLHNKPTESQTLIIMNMYQTPYNQYGPNSEPLFDPKAAQSHFDDFYQDLFLELAQIGEIEEIYVCRNLGDHLVGNVYVKFYEEESALKALEAVRGRYYNGKPLVAELSPVTDFREARCRQYDVGECQRGGYCNFMHLTEPSRDMNKDLINWQRKMWRKRRREARAQARAERRKKDDEERKNNPEKKEDVKREGDSKRRRSRSSSREHKRRRDDRRDERERERERERDRDRERKERDRDRRREREGRDSKRRGERERDKPDIKQEPNPEAAAGPAPPPTTGEGVYIKPDPGTGETSMDTSTQ